MINEQNAYAFCKDDIRLIENYDKAINDKSQMWECHHRKGLDYSSQWLKDNGQEKYIQWSWNKKYMKSTRQGSKQNFPSKREVCPCFKSVLM